jgi:hypothetical protein
MKLSKDTVNILKNFSGINTNLLIKKGSALSTISAQKNVFAEATVPENFPSDFGIYDLNEFLGVVSLFEDPDLTFNANHVVIGEGNNSVKYCPADPSVLTAPQKAITFPPSDIDVSLSAATMSNINKAASVLRCQDVAITGRDGNLTVEVVDKKNPSSNNYSLNLGSTDKEFTVYLKVENLKMIPGDYELSVSTKKISRFKNTSSDLTYYVAVEADSTFQ